MGVQASSMWARRPGWEERYTAQKRAKQAQARTSAMFGQMQEQSKAAEAASQAKYGEMLGVAEETTGQRAADIGEAAAGRAADITQQQARLGMSGTTVGTSLRGGVEREKQSALNRLADTMQQTKLGIMGEQAAAGERFAGQRMAVLGQQAGQAGAGQAQIEAARISAAPAMAQQQRSFVNWARATRKRRGGY